MVKRKPARRRRQRKLRAVFFDLDDTLIYEEQSIENAFARTCRIAAERSTVDAEPLQAAIRRTARDVWRAFDSPDRWGNMIGISSWEMLYGDFTSGDAPLLRRLRTAVSRLRLQAWNLALSECGLANPTLARELAEAFREVVRAGPTLFPTAERVLTELQVRFNLGMITNGAPDVQNQKIDGAKLRHYFQSIVISGDLGLGKPQREIFERALESLNTAPAEAVMVGNSFERDVKGAIEAGMRAVWVNLKQEELPHANVPFDTVTELGELIPLMSRK